MRPMLSDRIDRQWDADIVPQLVDYVRLPAKSPHFDPQWREHGHIEAAIQRGLAWGKRPPGEGMTLEGVRLQGRPPGLFFDIPPRGGSAAQKSIVLYCHLDKQPARTR